MTRILIVQGHPDNSRAHLCHAIAAAYRDAAERAGHSVALIEIARQDIPFVRSKAEWEGAEPPAAALSGQAAIAEAEHLVFIYPLWLGDVPAMLKAWLEQVLRSRFAFEMDRHGWRPRLGGRSARVIVTMGMPGLAYRWFYFAHSLRSFDRNILKFCGIRPVRWSVFGNVEDLSGRVQAACIAKAEQLGGRAR